jgi:hypothetical protein
VCTGGASNWAVPAVAGRVVLRIVSYTSAQLSITEDSLLFWSCKEKLVVSTCTCQVAQALPALSKKQLSADFQQVENLCEAVAVDLSPLTLVFVGCRLGLLPASPPSSQTLSPVRLARCVTALPIT